MNPPTNLMQPPMNLVRFIAICLVVWIAIVLIKAYFKRATRVNKETKEAEAARIGTMVRCDTCGLHVPEVEALKRDDKFYCSPQHREVAKRR